MKELINNIKKAIEAEYGDLNHLHNDPKEHMRKKIDIFANCYVALVAIMQLDFDDSNLQLVERKDVVY